MVPPSAESVDERFGEGRVDLGGGDATTWPGLERFLELSRARPRRHVYVEAPARALDRATLTRLRALGCHGIVIQAEAADAEPVARNALELGLDFELRLLAQGGTFPELVGVARRLRPHAAVLELVQEPASMPIAAVEAALLEAPNVSFSAARVEERGYLPACLLPALWRTRPQVFRGTLRAADADAPNDALPACARCALARRCRWRAAENESTEALGAALPPASTADLLASPRPVRSGPAPEDPVHCTTPWTTLEITQPDGIVHQCCSTWTLGSRGDAVRTGLAGVWNGEGYQAARRRMGRAAGEGLCAPICPRRYDRRFDESRFVVAPGSERFVRNQELVAEDIRERREVSRGMPLHLALCPSTYCNYDCVMCIHGRTPRRDLPDAIFDELPAFFPFLRTLTLLGGEPFAHPKCWDLVQRADLARFPDLRIDVVTNASLLTDEALRRIEGCALGHVTVSLNAGTPDTYARVQRGLPLESVLDNLDALLRFRARQKRWFGVTLSFVVQRDNRDDLLDFARLADARNLDIRLLPLSPEGIPEIDFFGDPLEVARIVERLDELERFARGARPTWLEEIRAVREATLAEVTSLSGGRRLPLAQTT